MSNYPRRKSKLRRAYKRVLTDHAFGLHQRFPTKQEYRLRVGKYMMHVSLFSDCTCSISTSSSEDMFAVQEVLAEHGWIRSARALHNGIKRTRLELFGRILQGV